MDTTHLFDGPTGRVVAAVMARKNADAEHEAVTALDPDRSDTVVAIGVGPGVGVELLARRVAHVIAVDPSQVMVAETVRRNRDAVDAGTVEVIRSHAGNLPLDDSSAHGAIAVNSIQLWDPIGASVAEVARVLRPGGRLVTFTHDWAIERSTGWSPEAFGEWIAGIASGVGLGGFEMWRGHAEEGRSVAIVLTKRAPR